jgi:hypothetical protein
MPFGRNKINSVGLVQQAFIKGKKCSKSCETQRRDAYLNPASHFFLCMLLFCLSLLQTLVRKAFLLVDLCLHVNYEYKQNRLGWFKLVNRLKREIHLKDIQRFISSLNMKLSKTKWMWRKTRLGKENICAGFWCWNPKEWDQLET